MDAAPPFRLLANPHHGVPGMVVLPAAGFRRARAEITAWPGYRATPLVELPASPHGIAALHVKDESGRFGLGSFKALGGAYAVLHAVAAALARMGITGVTAASLEAGAFADPAARVVVCCATDGNHGRSVAWGARRFGAQCRIFVHETVSPGRVAAIEAFGAAVCRVAGTYDDSVREAGRQAVQHGWAVVADTSYPGYTEIPRDVMQGYRVMVDEALDQIPEPPTHVFVQAGVGGLAAAVSVHLRTRLGTAPVLVVVEPDRAACLLASAEAGVPRAVEGDLDTIMAGLACGEPSLLAWQELERGAAAFLAVPDAAAMDAMRRLARCGVVSGESGAAGLAGLMCVAADGRARQALGLDAASRVLLFSTEGATDPALYAAIVGASTEAGS